MADICSFCNKELLGDKVKKTLIHYQCYLEKNRIRNRAAYRKRVIEKPEETRIHERRKSARWRAKNIQKCRDACKKWHYSEKGRYYHRITKLIRWSQRNKTSPTGIQRSAIKNILYRAKFIRNKDELSKPILSRDMNFITANKFIDLPPEKIASMDFRKLKIINYEKPPEIS